MTANEMGSGQEKLGIVFVCGVCAQGYVSPRHSDIATPQETPSRREPPRTCKCIEYAPNDAYTCTEMNAYIQETAHLLHDGKHPGLIVVVAVRADTQIDLLRVGVRLV